MMDQRITNQLMTKFKWSIVPRRVLAGNGQLSIVNFLAKEEA